MLLRHLAAWFEYKSAIDWDDLELSSAALGFLMQNLRAVSGGSSVVRSLVIYSFIISAILEVEVFGHWWASAYKVSISVDVIDSANVGEYLAKLVQPWCWVPGLFPGELVVPLRAHEVRKSEW